MSKDAPEYGSGPGEIPYRLPWRSSDVRIGAHRSKLEGTGGYFRDFVPLLRSPDPRRIDLRVSARDPFEGLHVRRFEQKASVSVYALVDVSASMSFRGDADKMRLAADLCTALAASTRRAGDAFGLIGCDAAVRPELTFLATRARGSEIEMLRRLRTFQPVGRGSRGLVEAAALIAGRRKLVFVISDFYMPRADIEAAFSALSHHDIIPIVLSDSVEMEKLPRWGTTLPCRFRGRPAASRRHAPASAGGMAKEERAPSRRTHFHRRAVRAPAIRDPRPHRLGSAGRLPRRWPRMMRTLMALMAVAVMSAAGAMARAPALSLSDTRPFGYFIGDAINREVMLRVGPGDALDTASLPRPGPLNYWLELSSVDLSSSTEGDDTLYRLSLTYQTFYAPLDTRRLTIPPFKLKLIGATDAEITVPEFGFVMSPIRQLFADKGQSSDTATKLRPDDPAQRLVTGRERTLMLVSGLATFAALVALAWHNAWWPFRRRPARPFTRRRPLPQVKWRPPARRRRVPRRAAEASPRLRPRGRPARALRRCR